MRIYIHQERGHDVEAAETMSESVIAEALNLETDELVLLEDSDEVIDVSLTFERVGIGDRSHVFRGRRHRIEAIVVFNGERHEREFSSSTRVERVFHWATGPEGFDLSKADAAEHQLALALDDTVPAGDVHLGSLEQDPAGVVTFNLIPKHRHEG
jgi:hypothetical protein